MGFSCEVALGGELCLLATDQAGHIGVQELPAALVIMGIAATVFLVELAYRLLHLCDVLVGRGIESILNAGLFGTPLSCEGFLEQGIVSEAFVDLDHAPGSGEDGDEGILEFVLGSVLEGLLGDVDGVLDRFPDVAHAKEQPDGGQKGPGGVVFARVVGGRIVHGDEPPVGLESFHR